MVLTDQNFQTEVIGNEGVTLVDFWATWCGPCKILGPIIDELEKDYQGKAKVGKLNVEENSQTPSQFGIMSLPTVLIFKNGEVVEQIVGAQPKEAYQQKIDSHL